MGGAGKATTRLARHTKARTLVTEVAKLATQPTAEALQGVAASKQKTRGINKDHVFEIFDYIVNAQLPPHERVTRSSVWKYLFRGSKTSGQVVEPLYGNEKVFKTTKKGGGLRRLTGVVWRDLDSTESRDVIASSLTSLEAYGVHVNVEQLKGLIQQELAKDAAAADLGGGGSVMAESATTATTATSTTATISNSSSNSSGSSGMDLSSPPVSTQPLPTGLPYALPTNPPPLGEAMHHPHQHQHQHPQHSHDRHHQQQHQQQGVDMSGAGSESSRRGSLGTTAMDSDLQQLLKLLTQKDTLEKLQAMVHK